MGQEIERKFLVDTTRWHPAGTGVALPPGLLGSQPERVVRARLEGDAGKLTIKGLIRWRARASNSNTTFRSETPSSSSSSASDR